MSLPVDGFFVWSCMEDPIGIREVRRCGHMLGSHALHIRVVGGRLAQGISNRL